MAPPHDNPDDQQRELHASPLRLSLHDIWKQMHEFNRQSVERHNKLEEKMDRFMEFTNGDGPKGEDGAVSRLNSHSADLGEIKDKIKWVERGLIAGLIGIALLVAGWGMNKVADGHMMAGVHADGAK